MTRDDYERLINGVHVMHSMTVKDALESYERALRLFRTDPTIDVESAKTLCNNIVHYANRARTTSIAVIRAEYRNSTGKDFE